MTTPRDAGIVIRRVSNPTEAEIDGLADVLVDCVEGGAAVSFLLPITHERATAFWRGLVPDFAEGKRLLFVAADATGIVGTVHVILAQQENQLHRGEIAKMLVHRRARRRGVGEALLRAAEDGARAAGRTLLVLETATPEAERIYLRCGWKLVGVIPDYGRRPHGGFCDTTYYYRRI